MSQPVPSVWQPHTGLVDTLLPRDPGSHQKAAYCLETIVPAPPPAPQHSPQTPCQAGLTGRRQDPAIPRLRSGLLGSSLGPWGRRQQDPHGSW